MTRPRHSPGPRLPETARLFPVQVLAQIPPVPPPVPAVGPEIPAIAPEITRVAARLRTVAGPPVAPNFTGVAPDLVPVAPDLVAILAKLATVLPDVMPLGPRMPRRLRRDERGGSRQQGQTGGDGKRLPHGSSSLGLPTP